MTDKLGCISFLKYRSIVVKFVYLVTYAQYVLAKIQNSGRTIVHYGIEFQNGTYRWHHTLFL